MEAVEIRSGPAKVIASGSVMTFAGNPVEISFGPHTAPMKLILKLREEDEDGSQEIVAQALDQTTLQMTVPVFSARSGSARPMRIGWMSDQHLYVHLRVEPAGAERVIHYCMYLSKEVIE
jgi:hypothetical protein